MSADSTTPNTQQPQSLPEKKRTLADYIKQYLFCDHDKGEKLNDETASTNRPRLEWSLDNKDRFWRKERDLGLSLEDAYRLKTLDHAIEDVNKVSQDPKTESLNPEKPIEMDFFVKPDGYGPAITLTYNIPTSPGKMSVIYIGGSFAELAEKAKGGLHRRPVLRTPSASESTMCKTLCCQETAASETNVEVADEPKTKTYADAVTQTDAVIDKETAIAVAVASVTEPGDEQIVKDLIPAPADISIPEDAVQSQSRSEFR